MSWIEVYKSGPGKFGWRRRAANNQITSIGGEMYVRGWNAARAAKKQHPGSPVRYLYRNKED